MSNARLSFLTLLSLSLVAVLLLGLAGPLPDARAADPETPTAVRAWFTDAEIPGSAALVAPADAPPAAPGSLGQGIRPTVPVAVPNPVLRCEQGLISFWICPDWDGDDGQARHILRIGDPQRNGLLLEKTAGGMLRYVMASPEKVTAARADVSHWKRGQWHQVAVAWFSRNGAPLGLPLWIDQVAVDGPIAGGNTFLNPATLDDAHVWVGDATTQAVIDELVFRDRLDTEGTHGQLAQVYRDYFRGAPYTRIAIEPDALRVPSDRRVVHGHQKQFGLRAWREDTQTLEYATDFAVRYGQWAEFDAKPLIRWTTSDESIATVDANGVVTGHALGQCTLTAEFRGLRDTYELTVISPEQPDLDLTHVERLPRYPVDRAKDRPDPGDKVESVAHVVNFGYAPAPAGVVVRFELIPDANRNFRCDADERPVYVTEQKIEQPLAPREKVTLTFPWTYTDEPTWVRVTVDPDGRVDEICEANNDKCELNTARPLRFALKPSEVEEYYTQRKINHVGSFSFFDWMEGQKRRFDVLLRDTVLPVTSPHGIEDAFRTDNFYDFLGGEWEQEPYVLHEKLYDGGFPINEANPVNLMAVDAAVLHEFGHTCLSQPDLYCFPVRESSVLLRDAQGELYAGGPLLPRIGERDDLLPHCSAVDVPAGVGYSSLMHDCHLWLHPSQAAHAQWYRGFRGSRFWGSQGRLLAAREHYLKVYDINDEPLVGAAVYVYACTQTQANDAGTKFFVDRPKFSGNTDADGRYRFADRTDDTWDDGDTDAVEGDYPVWNPFGRAKSLTGAPSDTAFTHNVWQTEGLLLVKIVSGDHEELAWLPITEMNVAFALGDKHRGVYPIRTSLPPATGLTPVVKVEVPAAIRETNLRPVATVPQTELTVTCGAEIRIDGSGSHDPEEQPLVYRWFIHGPGDVSPRFSDEPVYVGRAPRDPAELEAVFYVIDGLRAGDAVRIKIKVVAAPDAAAE